MRRQITLRSCATLSFLMISASILLLASTTPVAAYPDPSIMLLRPWGGVVANPQPTPAPDDTPWCSGLCDMNPPKTPSPCESTPPGDYCEGLWCGNGVPPWERPAPGVGGPPPNRCSGMDCGFPAVPKPPGGSGGGSKPPPCLGVNCGGTPGTPGGQPWQNQPGWSFPGKLGNPSAPDHTLNPVNLAYGHKQEVEVDLEVPLVGRDFRLARFYTSKGLTDGFDFIGARWQMNANFFLERVEGDYRDDNVVRIACLATGYSNFEYDADHTWLPKGASTQFVKDDQTLTVDIGDGSKEYPVYTLVEPDKWIAYFGRVDAGGGGVEEIEEATLTDGILMQMTDWYGNAKTFQYGISSEGTAYEAIRLEHILCRANGAGTDAARIDFEWFDANVGGVNANLYNLLKKVSVHRGESLEFEVQKVEYAYKYDGGDGKSDSVGTNGDLVQVVKSTLDDHGQWYVNVTQYRYHGGDLVEAPGDPGDADVDGFIEAGSVHQMKAVFMPQQIEYAAEQYNITADPKLTLIEYAEYLLTLDDGDDAFDTTRVMELASKVIARYEPVLGGGDLRVKAQYLQSACGCSAATAQGLQLEYEYLDYIDPPYARTTTVVESVVDENVSPTDPPTYVEFRTHYYDLIVVSPDINDDATDLYFLSNDVIDDGGGKLWVTRYIYDDADFPRVKCILMPSAIDSYTPGVDASTPPTEDPEFTAAGMAYEFAYNSDNRITATYIREGYDSGSDATRKQLSANTWDGSRLTKIELFRVASPGDEDDKETIEFLYTVHDGTDKIAWVETSVEAELETENGPGGVTNYYSAEYFDVDTGANTWSLRQDGMLISRTFDPKTGALTEITENVDGIDGGIDIDGLTVVDFSGRYASGGSLTTAYDYDLLGRVRMVTSPSGIQTRYVRELANTATLQPVDRDHFTLAETPYLALTILPAPIDEGAEGFAGPAEVTVLDAAGELIQHNTFSLVDNEASPYAEEDLFDEDYEFALDDKLTQSTVAHHLRGLVQSSTDYHSIAGDGENGGVYTTTNAYDVVGRLKTVTEPNESLTQYTYDVLDRVIKVEVGVEGDDLVKTAEYFYDSGGTDTPGVGDGNVTLSRLFPEVGVERDTIYSFDARNRLVKVEGPDSPKFAFFDYDNLNRPITASLSQVDPAAGGYTVADRGAYVETAYSQRGLVYMSKLKVLPGVSHGTDGNYLATFSWFDPAGRLLETWGPNAPAVKLVYDGLGRTVTTFMTDRRGDEAPGASDNYDDAIDVSDDVILEQTTNRYIASGDNKGSCDLVTHRVRTHDATVSDVGDLALFTSPDDVLVINTFTGYYYDEVGRVIRSVDFGTNSGSNKFEADTSAPTITQASPPTSSGSSDLVVEIAYNNRGLVGSMTDPMGRITKTVYDDLGRAIATIENWDNAALDDWDGTNRLWTFTGIDSAYPDTDRVTGTTYLTTDGTNGRKIKQIAYTSNSGGQVTEYRLGATLPGSPTNEDSLLNSWDLVTSVVYPDSGIVNVAYNQLGEVRFTEDQNGTKHKLALDGLGRLKVDHASTLGTNIDSFINAIRISYDPFGRVDKITSNNGYSNEGSQGTIKNAVQFEYTGLWQISDVWQQHDGDISGGSPDVTYAYGTSNSSAKNYSRLTSMTYPNGPYSIPYSYGSNDSTDDLISRMTALGAHASGDVSYSYIGAGLVALVDMAGPSGTLDVQLTRFHAHNGSTTSGEYPAFDRFGRMVRHMWTDDSFTTGSMGNSNIPAIVEITHTYDKASNPLTKLDGRRRASKPNRDFQYGYDDLNRMLEADRGAAGMSFTHNGGTNYNGSMAWTLDFLGNWAKLKTDKDNDGPDGTSPDTTENRHHNTTNELYEIDADNNNTYELALTHDDAGNLRDRPLNASGTIRGYRYTHDAWGRLVKVEKMVNTGTPAYNDIYKFQYNGLSWRTVRLADTTSTPNTIDQMTVMIYSAAWQLLEERIDNSWTSGFSADIIYQTIYGLRYIDDVICRQHDNDHDGSYTDGGSATYYQLSDDQFSTVAVLETDADLVERIDYDAYGQARHHWLADVDGDGDQDSTDRSLINALSGGGVPITSGSYEADMDIDRDGDVDSTDYGLASATHGAFAKGVLSDVGNIYGFSNYVFNSEANAGLVYTVRFRHYDTSLGRWIERDPLQYVDGMSMYGYCRGMPLGGMDPMGLGFWDGESWWVHDWIADNIFRGWFGDDFLINTPAWQLYTGTIIVCVAGGLVIGVSIYWAGIAICEEMGMMTFAEFGVMMEELGAGATAWQKFVWLWAHGYRFQMVFNGFRPAAWALIWSTTLVTGPTKLAWFGLGFIWIGGNAVGFMLEYLLYLYWLDHQTRRGIPLPAPKLRNSEPPAPPVPFHQRPQAADYYTDSCGRKYYR